MGRQKHLIALASPPHNAPLNETGTLPKGRSTMSGYRSHPAASRAILLLTIGLLCLGVLLQMLGVSVSFWNLNGTDDLLSNSILTGFAVLSDDPGLSLRLYFIFILIATASIYQSLLSYGLFRPPHFFV